MRAYAGLVVAVTGVGLLVGCGGGSGGGTARNVEAALPTLSRGLKWVGGVAPKGGALAEVAAGLGTAIDTGTSVRGQLTRIAASDDPYGEALVTATCYGLGRIAEQQRQDANVLPASAQSWETYLRQAMPVLLPPEYAAAAESRVTQFNDAAQLASIQPRLAYLYVRECAVRGG